MTHDPKQMAAIRAVIETGSFEAAAARLHVTASAVSQRVRALETRLGGPLVVRTRPCRPTPLGMRVMQHLRRAALLEADFASDLAGAHEVLLKVAIAVNADTLATWFMPALAPLLARDDVVLDVSVDDQDHTYALLASGQAICCITTQPKPMRGCVAEPLGAMRYRLVASPAFAARWFPQGLKRDAARQAPVLASTRKDALQSRFLQSRFGLPPDAYPCHYVPVPTPRYDAIRAGLGYGMVPELHAREHLASGALIDLAPNGAVAVDLYWHAWKVQSPRLDLLTAEIAKLARTALQTAPKRTRRGSKTI